MRGSRIRRASIFTTEILLVTILLIGVTSALYILSTEPPQYYHESQSFYIAKVIRTELTYTALQISDTELLCNILKEYVQQYTKYSITISMNIHNSQTQQQEVCTISSSTTASEQAVTWKIMDTLVIPTTDPKKVIILQVTIGGGAQ